MSYEIGLSGLHAAQRGLEVIGNNMANAATEGYHRQKIDLRPLADIDVGGLFMGQGVEVAGIIRSIDKLLDSQIVGQESIVSQLSKELDLLRTVESAFGELTTSGMSSSLDNFFASLHDLSVSPEDTNLQSMVVSNAESLAVQFRNLGRVVGQVETLAYEQALSTIEEVNALAGEIADLNGKVYSLFVQGRDANNLLDQRDRLVTELGGLIGITTNEKEHNVVDIYAGDNIIVLGSHNMELEVGLVENNGNYDIGVGPADRNAYDTGISGGRVGALVNIRNNIIRDISTQLNTVASTVVNETNKLHVQGIGSAGSFTDLVGWAMDSTDVSDFIPPVSAGDFYVRVTDASGVVTRTAVTVDPATSTLASVAVDINAIVGVSAVINAGKLRVLADVDCTFDFLPGVLGEPSGYPGGALAGAGGAPEEAPPAINISGIYTGSVNQTYTCTVSTTPAAGTLSIGSGTMVVTVLDGDGDTVAQISVGSGYESGALRNVNEGIRISFGADGPSPGYFNDGDEFEIEALANSDSTGFLSSVGLNTFFSGTSATTIALEDDIKDSPSRIATSRSTGSDNSNVMGMARLGDTALSGLDGLSIKSYYRNLATDIGNSITTTQVRQDNAYGMWQSLSNQRSELSGVDMNEEAAKMMLFEKMFQSMARYMNVLSRTMDTLMSVIS